MVDRVYNFSAGPAVLPVPVLEQAQRDLLALPGVGCSVLEISHRGDVFEDILEDAKTRLKSLLGIPDEYHLLFLQGGSRLQFSMVPMNLLRGADGPAVYALTGSWGVMAIEQARLEGPVQVAWSGEDDNFSGLPDPEQLQADPLAAYFHFTSNETIQGVQFSVEPDAGSVPLVCDASSDFLSRPIPVNRYGLIYACAQKNAGPAGVTIVLIHNDLVERCTDSLPGYLNYRKHIKANSLYNTPPAFGIYLVGLVARWLSEDMGGLEKMATINQEKSQLLYEMIDQSDGFYQGHARPECRSTMNVTFRLSDDRFEADFLAQAKSRNLVQLKGHRSVGGIRASIYNAMPREGVVALRDFMQDFLTQHG